MKKLIVFFLFVATLAFANPFVGRWGAGDVVFTFNETSIASVYSDDTLIAFPSLGNYTFDERIIYVDGIPWLYFVKDINHIGLIGWIFKDGSNIPVPVFIMMVRLEPERKDG
jgi:hypothetical protein